MTGLRSVIGVLLAGVSCLVHSASHLYWQQPETGAAYQHSVDSQGLRAGQYLPSVATPWRLASHGDFNGDGEEDLLWQHRTTGAIAFEWFRDGTHQAFSYPLELNDPGWQLAATGDLDADGKADLIWHHPARGDYYLWLWDGQGIKAESSLFHVRDSDWQLAFVRDFDGDGNADLLFRHQTSGANYLFSMDGLRIAGQQELLAVRDLNWQLVGAADLNGDNTADLVWRHQQIGQNYGFYLKQGRVESEVALPTVTDLNWQLHSLSDLNGDGQADLLWWHRTRSELVGWVMNGPNVGSEQALLTVTPGWQLAGVRAHNPGYLGKPVAVPGRIEAEFYDRSGAGVSFHDVDETNQGDSPLRNDGVDIEATTDTGGGANIGYIASGEWLKYQVRVTQAGHYRLRARVAAGDSQGQLRLLGEGQDLTGPVTVPITGGWQTWQTIESAVFELAAGEQALKLQFDTGLFNLNYVELMATSDPITAPRVLASPEQLSAQREGSSLSIRWKPVKAATSYLLERRQQDTETWVALPVTENAYQDQALVLGQSYQYRVQAQAEGYSTEVSAPIEVRWQGDAVAGRQIFEAQCSQCHGADGAGGSVNKPLNFTCSQCGDLPALVAFIEEKMPKNAPGSCSLQCAQDVGTFIKTYLAWGPDTPWPLEFISQPRAKAYPGLEYDSRLAVIGGVFPYRFSLVTAPTGMSLSETGVIRWTPTQEGTVQVSVKVEDSQAVSQLKTFSIQVTKTGFYFIAPTGVDNASQSGSLDKPWQSLGYAFDRSLTSEAVLYLRGGAYQQGRLALNDSTPVQLLAYPGEKPVIDMLASTWAFTARNNIGRFEGLELFNMQQYGIWTENNMAGMVVRNCVFRDGFENPEILSENPGFIHAAGHHPIAPYHQYFVIQDNVFKNFRLTARDSLGRTSQTSGAMVYFDVWYSLFENNQLLNIEERGITDKDNSYKNTYRSNYITGSAAAAIDIIGQYGAHQIDVHHNLIDQGNIKVGSHGHPVSNIHVHHNTVVNGSIALSWGVAADEGHDIRLDHNILSYELSNSSLPLFFGNLTTTNTWYFAPMLGHFQSDHNLLFSQGPYVFGAGEVGTRVTEYDLQQLQSYQLELNSIQTKAGLTGSGTGLGLPASSPFYGIYGHQY